MRDRLAVKWLREHPDHADAILAAILVVASVVGLVGSWSQPVDPGIREPDWLNVVLVLIATAPLAWRRRAPVPALVVMTLAMMIGQGFAYREAGQHLGPVIGAYSVAAHATPRVNTKWVAVFAGAVMGWVVVGLAVGAANASVGDAIASGFVFTTAWFLGEYMRNRREKVIEAKAREEQAEREFELEQRNARSRERTAIARELHDVVAHSMTVMVVQASGARRIAGRDPATAVEALRVIEETGRSSLIEMRRILGVLRNDESTDFAPQPSAARIGELATLDPSMPVEVITRGEPRELSPSVDVSAYRIVQEALTNARRHGGAAVAATVVLDYGARALRVRVDDDGPAKSPTVAPTPAGGNGLIGMRERVAVCGGSLQAGPRTSGGWSVEATLPYEERER